MSAWSTCLSTGGVATGIQRARQLEGAMRGRTIGTLLTGLIGAGMFSQGFINLTVENPKRILNVELTSTPQRAGPRDRWSATL